MAAALLTTTFIIIFLTTTTSTSSQSPKRLKKCSAEYGPFVSANISYYRTIFSVIDPATISNDALQITPDTGGATDIFPLTHLSGRVLLRHPFKLWTPTLIFSFNSSFLINIFRPKNETPAEGMAFIIAPNLDLPLNSSGGFLGITNATTDGSTNNKIVAIELDTYKQEFDPDDNHIGFNINSVHSVQTESLTQHGFEIVPNATRLYNVWVIYNGMTKVMDVYMAEQFGKDDPTPPMPTTPLLSREINLRDYVEEESYFGFSASTGSYIELNCVRRWNISVECFSETGRSWIIAVVLGVGVGVPVLVVLGGAVLGYYCYYYYLCNKRGRSNIVGALRSLPGTPREFGFKELKKATNNFDDKFKLGQGGYGVVYKCVLGEEEDHLEVAVKRFSRDSVKCEDDFLAELSIINRLRHKNLVRLLGWCHKNGKLLLLYEYMPNGSLDMHLFAGPDKEPLSWTHRYNIISGVAFALHYLHNEYDVRVVHRDIKASNIMLDSKFNGRLGDFGLARALDNEKTSYMEAEGVLGTVGYIAPECFHTGKVTQKSDVYAFGAVLIEVACGQRPGTKIGNFQFLVDWVWSLYREGRILDAVDKRLGEDYVAEEAERVLVLGLACSHPIASERPKTQTIVQILSGSVPAPHVPPFKPAFVWPAMVPLEVDISQTSTFDITSKATSNLGSGWSPQDISNDHSMV